MSLNTVLFDLDGTLIDSLPLIVATYRQVFDKFDIPWADGAVVGWLGRPIKDIARHFAGDRDMEFIERYQAIYALEHDQKTKLFSGAREMLSWLKKNSYKAGIVTSKRKAITMRTVDFLALKDLVGVVITANDVKKHKPDPEPVLEAIKTLNSTPNMAVYVGDSPFDLMSGKGAGARTIGVTWGMGNRDLLLKYQPDAIADSWDELVEIVSTWSCRL